MYTNKSLAEECHYKGKDYIFYVHQCGVKCFAPMSEREFINIGKTCDV